MPTSGPGPAGASPSLFTSIRTFWRVIVAILYTRLDLLTTELGEEAFRIMYLVVAGIVGVMALHGAFFFALIWILAAVWDTQYRLWVIGGIFLIYFIVALVCLIVARNMIKSRPRFLGQTLAELRRDVEGLQATVAKTKESHDAH
jgi:uncharacterized membrane protein YqjE